MHSFFGISINSIYRDFLLIKVSQIEENKVLISFWNISSDSSNGDVRLVEYIGYELLRAEYQHTNIELECKREKHILVL